MSKPTPKSNFLQTFLIITTLYAGFWLFIIKPQQDQKTTKPQEIGQLHQLLISDNTALKDVSIVSDSNLYVGRVNDLEKQGKLTKEQADSDRLEAAVLVADAQRKAGLQRNDSNRLRNAFNTLRGQRKAFENTPLWANAFDVPDDARFASTAWAAGDLYQKVIVELTDRNQHELTYGVFPGYQIIDALVGMTGRNPGFSYAFACFLLAFLVRAVVYPLSERQLKFSRQMQQLAPLTNEVRKQYKDDTQQQQLKVMEIYKEYGINPMAGCLPAFLQMPLFLTVYQFMLHYQFAFQQGTFLWITKSVASHTNGWTAPNLGEQDYVLIVIYIVTMLISTLLAPISDPTQVKQQRLMTVSVTATFGIFMFFWPLPSAFTLYWTFTNILSTIQSLRAYRRPLPKLEPVNAPGGGVRPKGPIGGKWMQMMEDMQKQAEAARQTQANGQTPTKPGSSQVIKNGEVKTGAPAKHKPKKRK
jgi:YidC/Oxa1 family membrane protein insertase